MLIQVYLFEFSLYQPIEIEDLYILLFLL